MLTPASSEFDFEGFGLVYLEANAHGFPVIGSFDNGGEDAIKDGYTGILTHSSDLISISNAIELFLTDKDLYASMSYNALDWAKQMLWRKKVADYITIIENIQYPLLSSPMHSVRRVLFSTNGLAPCSSL